jgi:1,2-dihydroxy-3-keto-5-methylthiopentene dioxygenase
MAEILIRNTNVRISDEDKVREFLESQEVLYEHWDDSKLSAELQENFTLTDEQKVAVLNTFEAEIKDLAARRGYKIWDVITLSEATPNLDELLAKFEQIHTHTEDEIRAIVAGKGILMLSFHLVTLFPYQKIFLTSLP